MFTKLLYGKHSEYGEWLEKIFRIFDKDCREIIASYQKSQIAKEALEDREYIEQQAARWFILAVYGFYLFKVLQRKDYSKIESKSGDHELIEQRTDTFFKAMNMGLGGDDTSAKICLSIIQRWDQGAGGLTPEYITAEALANHFDFSIGSRKDQVAFKEANTRFFQIVRDKRIIPALYDFLGNDDPDVNHILELVAQGCDGYSDRSDLDDSLPEWLKSKSNR